MNIRCCVSPSLCPDPSEAIGNFSSEAPDSITYIGRNWDPYWPPLGSNWRSTGCLGIVCESTVSQQAADECAQRQAIFCRADDPPTDDDPPVARATYLNDEQSCDFTCPDGSVFTYTVPAGTFAAFNQAAANNIAYSTACNRSVDFRICISELTKSAWCLNGFDQATCDFSGPVANYTSSIVSGSLPPGINYFQDGQQGVFSGTPTSAGAFTFTLRVEDDQGNFMQKVFTVNVVEILSAAPCDASLGTSYTQSLSTNVGSLANQTWSISSGTLPPGLNLVSSSITGTPTTLGTSSFTVRVVDTGLGITCYKALSINVGDLTPSVYWTMDNVAGLTDEMQGVMLASLPTNFTTGIINNGFHFVVGAGTAELNGVNKPELNHTLGQDMSFAFWVKVLTAADANDVYDVEYINDIIFCDISLELRSSMVLRANDGTNSFGESVPNSTVVLNSWYFFVITYEADSGLVKLYINGTFAHTGSVPVFLPTTVTDQSVYFQIRGNLGNNAMSCVMDETGFWFGQLLSSCQISQLYNSGAAMRPPGV